MVQHCGVEESSSTENHAQHLPEKPISFKTIFTSYQRRNIRAKTLDIITFSTQLDL